MHSFEKKIIAIILTVIITASSFATAGFAINKDAVTKVDSVEAATEALLNNKHVDDLERTDRSAVDTFGSHCLIDIGDCDNLGTPVDLIPCQPDRIAGAVAFLVVHQGSILDMRIELVLL